jgi:hypothetical protein
MCGRGPTSAGILLSPLMKSAVNWQALQCDVAAADECRHCRAAAVDAVQSVPGHAAPCGCHAPRLPVTSLQLPYPTYTLDNTSLHATHRSLRRCSAAIVSPLANILLYKRERK